MLPQSGPKCSKINMQNACFAYIFWQIFFKCLTQVLSVSTEVTVVMRVTTEQLSSDEFGLSQSVSFHVSDSHIVFIYAV